LGTEVRTEVSNVVDVVGANVCSETGNVVESVFTIVVKTLVANVVELLVAFVIVSVDNGVEIEWFAVDD
jgi:ATP/ADP translocase